MAAHTAVCIPGRALYRQFSKCVIYRLTERGSIAYPLPIVREPAARA